jgi:predicted anti-sigma-YlaC factor YlaD
MMRRVGRQRGEKADGLCDRICQAISAELDGEKPGIRSRRIISHVSRCQGCREFQQLAPSLGGWVGVNSSHPVPERLSQALLQEARTSERPRSALANRPRRSARAFGDHPWRRRAQWIGALSPSVILVVILPLGALSSPREIPSHDRTPCTVDLPALHKGVAR